MEKNFKGITIAREIILAITFCLTITNVILMIVQLATEAKQSRRYVRIKDSDELPF